MITSPRFIVRVNGEQRCVAGFDGYSVLTVGLDQARHERHESIMDAGVRLRVGGLQGRESVDWLSEDLVVGDEVAIRLTDGGPMDLPVVRREPTSCEPAGWGPHSEAARRVESMRRRLAQAGNVPARRLSVTVNGQHSWTIGVEFGVMSVMVTYVRRDPAMRPPHDPRPPEAWESGQVDLHLGGLEDRVHLHWGGGIVEVDVLRPHHGSQARRR